MLKELIVAAGLVALVNAAGVVKAEANDIRAAGESKVEVVFCLDTTGSMGGLIEGAKQKIWAIANQIIKGKPTPQLSVGLVGYRDKGDEYVTQVFDLSGDLDRVFDNLMLFHAGGGGDSPEHVNQALHEAVQKITWSKDPRTLKLIFLVGDCPPHMDYNDGYDYRDTTMEAVRKDIIVNTIQCGEYSETEKYFRDIARLAEGRYARVEQTGAMQFVQTPFDDELAELNIMLEGTVVAYGSNEAKEEASMRKDKLKLMKSPVAAERAAFKMADEHLSAWDLIDAINTGNVKLSDIKNEELPEEMKKMNTQEKRNYLAKKEKERKAIKEKIEATNKKRSSFITDKLKESAKSDSFDEKVQEFIKEQASAKGISY